jgi:hypothetical protein
MKPGAKEPRAPASGPNVGAQTFASFGAFAKGSRRQGETASRNTQKNGYTQKTPKNLVGPKAAKSQPAGKRIRKAAPPIGESPNISFAP